MKIATEPRSPAEVPSTLPTHLDRLAPRSMPLRRAFVLVLLVLSFALSLAVMDRARREVAAWAPDARPGTVVHTDLVP